jgi:hypothetical protein
MRLIRILFVFLVSSLLFSCKKDAPAPQDTSFEIKYSSSGLRGVSTSFGICSSSYMASPGVDVIAGTLATSSDGQVTGNGRYRSGDKLYGYVKFLDITNPNAVAPAANGFLAAAFYINNTPSGVLRLTFNDYYNSPQKMYVDKDGKTNLIIESTFVIP